MMYSKDLLTARLKEVRGGMTQAGIARVIGMSQQGWARYESGKVAPGAELLHQICSKCNVSADWLLGLSEERGAAASPDVTQLQQQLDNLTRENESLRMALEAMLASRKSVPPANRATAS